MKIRKSTILPTILCGVLLMLAVSGSFIFFLSNNTVLALIAMAILAGTGMVITKYRSINWTVPYLAVMFLVILKDNCYLNTNIPNIVYYILIYLLCFVFCVSSQIIPNWIDFMLKWMKRCLMVYAVATIWLSIDRFSYINLVLPLFPNTRDQLLIQYNSGCIPGLTNHYSTNGMFLATLTCLCATQFMTASRKKNYWISLAVAVIALLLTGKRAHIGFTVLALFSILYFYYSNNERKRITRLMGVLIVGTFVAVALFTLVPSLAVVLERFQIASQMDDPTLGRSGMVQIAMLLFLSNPIQGIGWGNAQSLVFVNTNIHNVYAQLLAETGIVGFTVFVGWFIIILVFTLRKIVAIRKGRIAAVPNELFHLCFSGCFQVFFLVYCMTGNPLYDRMMYIPYFIACSITLYYNRVHKYNR